MNVCVGMEEHTISHTNNSARETNHDVEFLAKDWESSAECVSLKREVQDLEKLITGSIRDLGVHLHKKIEFEAASKPVLTKITEEGLDEREPQSLRKKVESSLILNCASRNEDSGDSRGIRLKFQRDVRGQFKSSNLGDALGVPHACVRVFESQDDVTVLFLKVKGFQSDWGAETSEDIAWKVFGLCKNRPSALYHFNRAEVFCRHPIDIEPQLESSTQFSTEGALEDCVGAVLAAGGGVAESSSQSTFVRFCRDIRKALGALDSDANYLDQLCANGLMVMEPLITTMARYKAPKLDRSALGRESAELRELIDVYLERTVRDDEWAEGSQQLEQTLKSKLLAHLDMINQMRSRVLSDSTTLSLVSARGANILEAAEEQGLQIARQLRNESHLQELSASSKLKMVEGRLQNWDAEKEKAFDALGHECEALERQSGRLEKERAWELGEIRRKLAAYQEQSGRQIEIARQIYSVRQQQDRLRAEAETTVAAWSEKQTKLRQEHDQWSRVQAAGEALEKQVQALAATVRSEHGALNRELQSADVPLETACDLIRYLTAFLCLLSDRIKLTLTGEWRKAPLCVDCADGKRREEASSLEDELREATDTLEERMTPLWSHLQSLSAVSVVCRGSAFELLVMSTGAAAEFLDLPHPRALRAHLQLADVRGAARPETSADALLDEAAGRIVAACAKSAQFEKEMQQVSAESKRAGDVLARLRAQAASARVGVERMSSEEATREDDAKAAAQRVAVLEREVDKCRREVDKAEVLCRRVEEDAERYDEERRQQLAMLAEAEAMMARAKQALLQNGKDKKEATDRAKLSSDTRKKSHATLEQKKGQLSKAIQQKADAEQALKRTRQDAQGRRGAGGEVERELREAEEAARLTREAVERYRHIGGLGKAHGEGQEGWVVRPDELVVRVNVWLGFKEQLSEVAASERRERAFRRAVEESVRRLVSEQCSLGGSEVQPDSLARRIRVEAMRSSLVGGAEVNLVLLDDDALPAQAMIDALRAALFPHDAAHVGEIGIGEGQSGEVTTFRVCDPLGRGRAGKVREAEVGSRRVVVKEVRVFAEQERLAVMRGGQLTKEVAARVTALCVASHPNLLAYQGVCFHDCQPGLPFCSVLQDFCPSTLAIFLSEHHAPHDPTAELPLSQINAIFHALDPDGKQVLSLKETLDALQRHGWVREALSLGPSAAEHRLMFAAVDREGSGRLDVGKLVRYLGPRARGDRQLPWAQRMQIAVDVARGMAYLQGHGIVHGSLSSHNIGLRHGLRVQIMDFGLAHVLATMPQSRTSAAAGGGGGTAWREDRSTPWMAPERLAAEQSESAGDVWSYGVVLWELVTGEVPWAGKQEAELTAMAKAAVSGSDEVRMHLTLPDVVGEAGEAPPGYVEAMQRCWEREPWRRPAFAALLSSLLSRRSEWPRDYLPG